MALGIDNRSQLSQADWPRGYVYFPIDSFSTAWSDAADQLDPSHPMYSYWRCIEIRMHLPPRPVRPGEWIDITTQPAFPTLHEVVVEDPNDPYNVVFHAMPVRNMGPGWFKIQVPHHWGPGPRFGTGAVPGRPDRGWLTFRTAAGDLFDVLVDAGPGREHMLDIQGPIYSAPPSDAGAFRLP